MFVVPTGINIAKKQKVVRKGLGEEVKCRGTIGQYALYMVHTLVEQIRSHPPRNKAGWLGLDQSIYFTESEICCINRCN